MKPSKILSCALVGALLAVPASAFGESRQHPHSAYDSPFFATAIPPATTATPTPRPAALETPSATDGHYTIGSPSAQEQEAYNYLSEDRKKNGLPTLTLDPALCALARLKSQDMLSNGYFAHTSPTLGSASDMLKAHGYSFNAVGENIAHHASVLKSHAAFLSSEGHRRNMMSSSWAKVGIGVVTDKGGSVYVTQLFAR